MPATRQQPIRFLACRRFAFSAALSALALLVEANSGSAYVPIYAGPEYNTTTKVGYQSDSAPYVFERNLVNNSGTAVGDFRKSTGPSSLQLRAPFQWQTNGAPPTEMNAPAGFAANNLERWTYAINDSGTAVGATYNDTRGENPTRWDSSGTATLLANFGTRQGSTFTWGQAHAINNAGTVVGYSERWIGGNYYDRAARWNAGGTAITELGEISAGVNRYSLSRALAVNESGTAVGWAQKLNFGVIDLGHRPVRWDGTGTAATELGNLGTNAAGVADGQAYDVNESGTAVGYSTLYGGSSALPHAVRWDANGTAATQLDDLGGPRSEAFSINDAGTAVGYGWTDTGSTRALRWDSGGSAATVLGAGRAYDINNSGTAVGDAGLRAMAWRNNATPIDLNNVIDAASGWTLTSAFSISDTHWITGQGNFDPDGPGSLPAYSRYFTLQLPDPLPGDYNADYIVDAADYTFWRDHMGQSHALTGENPAATTPGLVDQEDFDFWTLHFGESIGSGTGAANHSPVPEPTAFFLLTFAALVTPVGQFRRN